MQENPAKRKRSPYSRSRSENYHMDRYVEPHVREILDVSTQANGSPLVPLSKSKLPPVIEYRALALARAMSRAKQSHIRVVEMERYFRRRRKRARALRPGDDNLRGLPLVMIMSKDEFARYSRCQEISLASDLAADRLLKALSEEIQRMREPKPVASLDLADFRSADEGESQ